MTKTKFILSIVFFILICLAKPVWAADDFSLGVYPPILEIWAKPGQSATAKLRLYNKGNATSFRVYPVPSFPADELGNIVIATSETINEEKDKEKFRFLSWVAVFEEKNEVNEVEVKKDGTKDLDLVISVPSETNEREYFFTLLFEAVPVVRRTSNASYAVGRVGANVILTVSGEKEYKVYGEIKEFSAPKFIEGGPVPFTVRVENVGKNHFKADGRVVIYDMLGKKAGEVKILPAIILPDSTRRLIDYESFETIQNKKDVLGAKTGGNIWEKTIDKIKSFSSSLETKEIEKSYQYVVWKPKFLLGKYKAKLAVNYDGKKAETAEITFWAIPIKLILGIVVIILILMMIKKRVTKS